MLGMSRLNVMPPTLIERVTHNIDTIIKFIAKLVEQNMAYKTDRGEIHIEILLESAYGRS